MIQMGKVTVHDWGTSPETAPSPVGIVFGANLRKPETREENPKTRRKPDPDAEGSDGDG